MGLAPYSCACDGEMVHGARIARTAPSVPIADLRLIGSADRSLDRAVVGCSMLCSIGLCSIAIDGCLVAMVEPSRFTHDRNIDVVNSSI